jgi:integral membrane sensor domain MASE1
VPDNTKSVQGNGRNQVIDFNADAVKMYSYLTVNYNAAFNVPQTNNQAILITQTLRQILMTASP